MLTASRDRNAGLQPAGPLSTAESANEKLDHHLPVVDVVMQTTDPVSTVEAADPVIIAEPTSEKSFRDVDLPVVDVVMQTTDPVSTVEAACGFRFIRGFLCIYFDPKSSKGKSSA